MNRRVNEPGEPLARRIVENFTNEQIEKSLGETAMFKSEELKERTKKFAIRIVFLFRSLPRTEEARVMGKQLLRSATSVAANYRAVCRARSQAEFISKISVVVEEADESIFWLELLIETETMTKVKIESLLDEANQILAIFAASQNTVKKHRET